MKPTLFTIGALIAWSWACQPATAGMTVLKSDDNFKAQAGAEPNDKNPLEGKLVIRLEGSGGWKVSPEAPLVIDLSPPEGLSLAKTKLKNTDKDDPKSGAPSLAVSYTAKAKGRYPVKLKFDVVLCTEKMCQKKRFESEFPLDAG
ncbi:MAG: hypothetical protein GYA21_18870 [Myxococcales bacterium]|nr:hypothetical protein [Myxococcales bacterium]